MSQNVEWEKFDGSWTEFQAVQQRKYYLKNREKRNAQQREYYKRNREKFAAYQREYRQKNREKYAAQQRQPTVPIIDCFNQAYLKGFTPKYVGSKFKSRIRGGGKVLRGLQA